MVPVASSGCSPQPKARCPHCARPVALLRRTHCIYCGKTLGAFDAKLPEPSGEAALAIAQVMLEQGTPASDPARRWMMRVVAMGVGVGWCLAWSGCSSARVDFLSCATARMCTRLSLARGNPTPMFESLNDPVDVLTAFVQGRIQPLRFRWQGKVIRVRKVTGEWSRREGQSLLKFFAVEGGAAETYELCYDPRVARWTLSRAWTDPSRP